MGVLSPFTFNVIADTFEFKPAILLSVFYLLCLFHVPFSSLSCLLLHQLPCITPLSPPY